MAASNLNDLYLSLMDARTVPYPGRSAQLETELFQSVTNLARSIVFRRAPDTYEDVAQLVALRVWRRMEQFDAARSSFNRFVRINAEAVLMEHLSATYRRLVTTEYDPEVYDYDESVPDQLPSINYELLRDAFADDTDLLDLLITGYSLTECEAELGITRSALRHKIKTAKIRAAAAIYQSSDGMRF